MLVVDDNRLKLLKMKEKLLEVSLGGNGQVLSEYRDIVTNIDKEMYEVLVGMIRNTNYHNLSLEEQLIFFNNLEREYNSFYEFQCRYKNVYAKYSFEELKLSSLDNIYIDKIREKISAISGYLINSNNLLKYRNSIEKYNVELIEAEKKKEAIVSRLISLENSLLDSALNAEGRIYNNDNLEPASIVKEYNMNGLNLVTLLKNDKLLREALLTTENLVLSQEDEVKTAKVCYDKAPNDYDMKKLYNTSAMNLLKTKYKLVLLQMANLVQKQCTDYIEAKDKRKQIIDLLNERTGMLKDLGIRYYVDPFNKIKENLKLEIVELLGGNIQDVSLIKEKIKNTLNLIEGIETRNDELFKIINKNNKLLNDTEEDTYKKRNVNVSTVDNFKKQEQDNSKKIIRIRNASDGINYNLIHAKTNGVVSRVYEMLTNTYVADTKQDVVPNLVVVQETVFDDMDNSKAIFDLGPEPEKIVVEDNKVQELNDVFEEVKPFEDTVLYTNRFDDTLFTTNVNDAFLKEEVKVDNKENNEMSELFTTNVGDAFLKEEVKVESDQNAVMPELLVTTTDNTFNKDEDVVNNEENDKVLSFEEQVQLLMNSDVSKTKKRVA